jgi:hypothetical protein
MAKEITYASKELQYWGFSDEVKQYDLQKIKDKNGICKVIHWYGKKPGFISLMPGSHLLDFYERYYYAHIGGGKGKLFRSRLSRTLGKAPLYFYEYLKKLYYSTNGRKQYEHAP